MRQIATLDKGHSLLVADGLQIWGADTDTSYSFNYNTMAGANLNGVMWGFPAAGLTNVGVLSTGQKWGSGPIRPAIPPPAMTSAETADISDLLALQVGDEQDLSNNTSGASFTQTVSWFQTRKAATIIRTNFCM